MKRLDKAAKIVTKILEVTHWVGAALLAAAAVCTAAAPQWVKYFVGMDLTGAQVELATYGFEITVPVLNGRLDTAGFLVFAVGGVILFSLVAMIFRNLHLIIRRSEGTTPFQKDNVRMVREIGIFSIAIPLVGLLMSTVARLVMDVDLVETSVRMDGVLMGIIVLCLSQVFSRGVELEQEVDGLL